MKGRLLLVPAALSENNPSSFLAFATLREIHELKHFVAERAKTARQYLKSIEHPIPMAEISVSELNKHGEDDFRLLLQPCFEGHDCGLISEAGVPGVADPGGEIVRYAHQYSIEVVPLVGPSSLLLALMASGMNGQRFSFHGYLAKDESELARQLKELEAESTRNSMTQMFIETPYRNLKMMDALLKTLNPQTEVCVASNLCASDQKIETKTVAEWKKSKINFDRKPSVFLIFSGKFRS
ncbi:MAG: SAM-dependent methyltransferase [Flavobacteriales bacterium]